MGLRLSPENILITHIDPGSAEECPWQFGCDLGAVLSLREDIRSP